MDKLPAKQPPKKTPVMNIEPIAFFRSPFTSKFGIPRQSGLAEDIIGRIVFEPKFSDSNALRGLEDFDYLWLIWGFSANKPQQEADGTQAFRPTVRPPRLGGNERLGVFATRSPFRPNGLGLSSVRIVHIENGDIVVAGADLMDGTPIYDIKPYLTNADSHPTARAGFTDKRQWRKLNVVFSKTAARLLDADTQRQLRPVLELDPRPHYQNDPERVYGMPFGGMDIHFSVDGDTLTVTGVTKKKDGKG